MKGKHTRIDHWVSEFKHYCSGIPILVVGTKKDVRDDVDALLQLAEQKLKPVKASELASVCKKLKAIGFLECSAKSGDGIEQVFLTALKLSLTM
jgi:GTPase SAR1 family protein